MLNKLEQATIKFNGLALRLRIMFTLASVAMIFMLFDLFWFSENSTSIKRIEKESISIKKQNDELVAMQKQQNQDVLQKRSNPKSLKLSKLIMQLSKARKELTEKTVNLVQPQDMANVIKKIIESTNSLQLQMLSKQETVELSDQIDSNKENEASDKEHQVRLFRHSMEIVLKGSFSSTHDFLNRLEKMERKVAFDNFEYTVNQHPIAQIKLTVSTLSLQKEWIGG